MRSAGGFSLPGSGGDWLRVLYMEPVFASAFAVTLGGENLTVRMLVGGACVVGAMYLVELAPRRRIEAEVQHLAR